MDHLRFSPSTDSLCSFFCLLPSHSLMITLMAVGEELFDNHGYSLTHSPPHHCCYHFTDCLDDVDSICDCLKIIFFNIKQTSWYFVRFVVSDGFGNLSESLLIAFTCRLENFLFFNSFLARILYVFSHTHT